MPDHFPQTLVTIEGDRGSIKLHPDFRLVVTADGEVRPVIALVSCTNRLDEAKFATASGAARVARVDADRVRAVTGFPIGGVPPFGHPTPVPTFVDPGLLDHAEVWAAGGTPQVVFGIAPAALVVATEGDVRDLAVSAYP